MISENLYSRVSNVQYAHMDYQQQYFVDTHLLMWYKERTPISPTRNCATFTTKFVMGPAMIRRESLSTAGGSPTTTIFTASTTPLSLSLATSQPQPQQPQPQPHSRSRSRLPPCFALLMRQVCPGKLGANSVAYGIPIVIDTANIRFLAFQCALQQL